MHSKISDFYVFLRALELHYKRVLWKKTNLNSEGEDIMTIYFKDYRVQVINKGSWAPVSIVQLINQIRSMESGN